jgi:hypothetical protein
MSEVLIEEKQCVECYILSGGSDIEVSSEIREELSDFQFAHMERVTF